MSWASVFQVTQNRYIDIVLMTEKPFWDVSLFICEWDDVDLEADTDGDGLSDYYERCGIRLLNGEMGYTEVDNPDTDGDGLTDSEELGEIVETEYYIGRGKYETVQYYDAKSNPLVADTDGDGISDDRDPHPWYKEGEWVAELSNKYPGVEYLKIVDKDGNMTHGGAQGWWSALAQNESDEYIDFAIDKNYQIGKMGCGLIAVTDVELYLMQQNEGYQVFGAEIDFDPDTGVLQKDDYMVYVDQGPRVMYDFAGGYLTFKAGLIPVKMENGLKYFLYNNGHEQTDVKWAPYANRPNSIGSGMVLEEIEDMLDKDLPVVFAYHTSDEEDKLILYADEAFAMAKNKDAKGNEKCRSHYMTIIG